MLITTEWLDELDLNDTTALANGVAKLLDSKKGKDVVVVDVRGSVVLLTDKRTWTSLSQKKF